MTLLYVTQINGLPTYFPEKIWSGLKHIPITEELANYLHSDKSTGIDIGSCIPKIHSIRGNKKNKWKVGNKIHSKIWSGKPYKSKTIAFAPVLECKSIQKIEILYDVKERSTKVNVLIDDKLFGNAVFVNCKIRTCSKSLERLSVNDGFDDVNSFLEYFDKDYQGVIIQWTNFKY